MRAEDKQLEGADLEHEEERTRDLVAEEELAEVAGEEVVDLETVSDRDRDRQRVVLATIRAIFDQKTVTVSLLGLPDHETRALASLQHAVTGRGALGTFIFADDRRDLLERALAVLQPNLTHADPELVAELGAMDKLTATLGTLRAELDQLGEAQEVIPEWEKHDWFGAGTDDKDDKDDAKPEAADIEVGTTLTGPERAEAPKPRSTLDGPDAVDVKPPSSLYEDAPK